MRDTVEFISRRSGSLVGRGTDVEAVVDVCIQRRVSDAWLSKCGDPRIPAAVFEVKAGECGYGTAEGVADKGECVGGVGVDGFCEEWEDGFAGVEPGGVEPHVDGAVVAFWRIGGRGVVARRRIEGDILDIQNPEVFRVVIFVVSWIRYIFLGYC